MNNSGNHFKSWITAGIILLATVAAFYLVRPAYRHFKEKHDLARARAYLSHGDYLNALISARQTLLIDPNNVEACRIMADISDSAHLPATLDWLQQIVKIDPTVENKLVLAAAGLSYQDPPYPLTTRILADLSKSADGLAIFHIVSAERDMRLNRQDDAQTQFAAACRLDPTNRRYQLNLAVIRLESTNAAVAAAARVALRTFCADTNLAPAALRSLAADRLLHNDPQAALEFSAQLLKTPQATLNDRLQHLGILRRLKSPELAVQLNSLEQQSNTNALMANELASWMEANGLLDEAFHWLTSQPAGFQSQPLVRLAIVDCYLNRSDWKSLQEFLSKGDWGDMEYLRQAFLSRTWNQMGESLVANGNWQSAVNLADGRLGALNALLQLAERWDMKSEQQNLLWRIIQKFPDDRWASDALAYLDFATGDTADLRRLYSKLLSDSPKNVADKNNLALTSLLLKTNLTQAFQWAEEACAQNPDATTTSTCAYALYLQNRTKDGLAMLQKLPTKDLEQPSVALYYGVLLSAAGKTNEAAHFLTIAATQGRLLPEEKKLLLQAQNDK